jgi:hypothetical protein
LRDNILGDDFFKKSSEFVSIFFKICSIKSLTVIYNLFTMNTKSIAVVFCLSLFGLTQKTFPQSSNQTYRLDQNVGHYEGHLNTDRNKVLFEENKGQVKDQDWQPRPDILYYGQSEGMNFFVRNNGISYQLQHVDSWMLGDDRIEGQDDLITRHVPDQTTTYRVDINWINAQYPQIQVQGLNPGYNNYYNVPDNVAPALHVNQYEKLTLKSLWPGVDMEYYSRNGHLESDWIVHQARDYKQIAFEIMGADLRIENGQLIMKTPLGEIVEGALKTYQNNREIKSNWKIEGNKVSLEIEYFDPTKPLRIDPPVRIWGTYYGDFSLDYGHSCSVDGSGNVYLVGYTYNNNAIATSGAHQTTLNGTSDAFLVKFNSSGVRQWGTYYGGSGNENGWSCAVDGSGNVYLAGGTNSINGIATSGVHEETNAGGTDAFLAKFNSNGIRQWGTYYGGNFTDAAHACKVDDNGNVYMAGYTTSTNGIATSGVHQETYAGGDRDAFLVKFNGNGTRQWGTYYGGSGYDNGESCAVDGNGNVYLAGFTTSTTAISTSLSHQQTYGGGNCVVNGGFGFCTDAFLVKFNSNGTRLWGTYYGGDDDDKGQACAVDASGFVYLAGRTESFFNIATSGAHQTEHYSTPYRTYHAFLVKFNHNGIRQWGTFYGGQGDDYATFCTTDANGDVYIAGQTKSFNNIATSFAHQTSKSGGSGNFDAFLAKFNSNGVSQWGTFYGGDDHESDITCAVDDNGYVYLAGTTESNNAIATTGAHQETNEGNSDAFLVKLYGGVCTITLTSASGTNNQELCINTHIDDIEYSSFGAAGASFSGLPTGVTGNFNSSTGNIIISGTPTQSGTFNYTVTLTGGCNNVTATGVITVNPDNTINLISASGTNNQSVCINSPITNITYSTTSATGATFSGLPAGLTTNINSATGDITISGVPSQSGTFNYIVNLQGGCGTLQATGVLLVYDLPNAIATSNNLMCAGQVIQLQASGGISYFWTGPIGFNSSIQNPSILGATQNNAGTYIVTVTDANNCQNTDEVTIAVLNAPIQEVCVVTVDDVLANHNIIFWEKPADIGNIDSFYVYREITFNNYQKIGAKHVSEISDFSDFGANPNTTSYKYRVTTLDTCGNESEFGLFHKSIHLQYSGLGNFQWTFYEIENTPNQVASYNFWRDNTGDGSNWQILQTVSGSSSSFTDIDYANFPNAIYRVDLNWINQNECTSTRANINTSRSNTKGTVAAPVDGIFEMYYSLIQLYPNPTNAATQLYIPEQLVGSTIAVTNAIGQVFYSTVARTTTLDLDLGAFANGIYFVKIDTVAGMITKKVVKN